MHHKTSEGIGPYFLKIMRNKFFMAILVLFKTPFCLKLWFKKNISQKSLSYLVQKKFSFEWDYSRINQKISEKLDAFWKFTSTYIKNAWRKFREIAKSWEVILDRV